MKVPEKPPKVTPEETFGFDVFKLLEKPEIIEFISKCNSKYVHWDQLRHKEIPDGVKPEQIWFILKLFRRGQYKLFEFDGWEFRYLLTDESQRRLHLLDKGAAGHLGTSLESMTISETTRNRYIISSLMEEAIASSQLEGAVTTRKVAKEILRKNKKPRDHSEQMIVNGYRTIQKIIKMKDKKITPEIILNLQREITMNTLKEESDSGRFRDNNDVVVAHPIEADKIYYSPPDYKEVPQLIEKFCEFANEDNKSFIHPVIKGILLHFLIAYIHPFNDGNGRTARTIFYWYVLKRGYWLFEYMSISRVLLRSRKKYGLAYLYTETDDNDLTYFINYNLKAIEEALHDMEKYIDERQKEQAEAMELIKSLKNINLRQAEILKDFIKEPEKGFLISEIMTSYDVAYDTARTDLLHLAEQGYLEKIKVQNRFIFKLVRDSLISD